MQLYAQHIMNTRLVTVHPEMTCNNVKDLFILNKISGAPVVNQRGVLVGVITMRDIIKAEVEWPFSPRYFEDNQLDRLFAEEGFHVEPVQDGFVSDHMTREVYTAFPHTPVEELAKHMLQQRIHRLIIVHPNEQKPVGIVTTYDLLKLIAIADDLESTYDACSSWYARKFSQMKYETIPTLNS